MIQLTLVSLRPSTINEWADYWRYQGGVNVLPADTRNKMPLVEWKQYQNSPITEEQYQRWKNDSAFSKGMALIPGKIWHNPQKEDVFLAFIDLDNQKAIEEFCNMNGKASSLEKLSEHMIVEQHKDDLSKAHIYCYTKHPLTKKSSDRVSDVSKLASNKIPALEVKGLGEHGIAYCTPSLHRNGSNYEIIGTTEPELIDGLEQQIDSICRKYNIPYLYNGKGKTLVPMQELFKPETKIFKGHNRHEAVLRVMDSLIKKLTGIMPLEKIKELAWEQSHRICDVPLEENELERQWNDALRFIERKTQESNRNLSGDNGRREPKNNNVDQAGTSAEIVVELAKNNTLEFFKDQYGAAFAVIRIGDHNEVIGLGSSRYRRYLCKLFYDNNDHKVINSESVSNAIQVLQAKAEYESPTIPLSLRVAWSKDEVEIYYDLTDEKWRSVRISKNGWKIVTETPTLFIRYNQTPQVQPLGFCEGDIFDKFFDLTNIKDESGRLLLKVYMASLFIPDIDHAVLMLHGEKGSAKSTLQYMIKLLIDPAKPALLTINYSKDEFVQQLNHNYVSYYDNVKGTPKWLSDEVCKAVSKVGTTKRKLFTDDEDIVYEYQRCIGFNGVNVSLREPDVLDRSILIELNRIRKESNQLKTKILAQFEKIRPRLLAYIFEILSRALSIKESIQLKEQPRMGDFAAWGEAISRAMGHQPFEFIDVYFENIGKQNVEAVEAHPLGLAIIKLCEHLEENKQSEWFGSTSDLLEKLNEIAELNRIRTDSRYWPKATNSLSRSLNRIRSNLIEGLGIEVLLSRVTNDDARYSKNTSTVKIRKISPLSPQSPPAPNQARIATDKGGDIVESGDTIPPLAEIPPPEVQHKQARITSDICQSGDSGYSGGTIHKTLEDGPRSVDQLLKCPHCNFVNQYPETLAHHILFTHNNGGGKQ